MIMRDAFGQKLKALGAENKKIVVLDADVSGSSKSTFFAAAYPDRFLNCGVSEGNMAGVAAGLASAGFHPVINAFAIFVALKCTDQLRHDFCYNKLPVVIAGAYGGFSDSYDGASHQSVADLAILRALPNMEVIAPGDNKQAELALEYALSHHGPVYIRLTRGETADLPNVQGFATKAPLLQRPGSDVTIAATGLTAQIALEAATLLEKKGVQAEVFSVPFVKPIEGSVLEASVKKTGRLITVEEHSVVGGFGSACLEKLALGGIHFSYAAIGAKDTFGDTGAYDELLNAFGLTAQNIASVAAGLAR
jgi:transketolase